MMPGMRNRENTHVSLSSWDTLEAGKQSLDKANVLLVCVCMCARGVCVYALCVYACVVYVCAYVIYMYVVYV